MCPFFIKFTFIILILVIVNPINCQNSQNSQGDDAKLHYLSRLIRDCNSGGLLTRILSIFIFLFYILIILGLIKAIIGICCNQDIGMAGLGLLIEPQFCEECNYLQPQISCQTEFFLNLVFFLVAPICLLWRMVKNTCLAIMSPCPCPQTCPEAYRMPAGGDDNNNATLKKSNTTINKTKKPAMDVYRDGDDSETYDTNYVLQQLHISEQSIRPEHTNYQSCNNVKKNDAKKKKIWDIHRLWP